MDAFMQAIENNGMSYLPGNNWLEEELRRSRDFLGSVFNCTFNALSYKWYFFIVVGQRDVMIV